MDMVEEGYDLVIRVNPTSDETLVGRAFLHDRLVLVAGPGAVPSDLNAPLPAVVRGGLDAESFMKLNGEREVRLAPVLGVSSLGMARDAVRDGIGVAALPISLVHHDLADGRLELVGDVMGPEIALWALYPSRRLLKPARLRLPRLPARDLPDRRSRGTRTVGAGRRIGTSALCGHSPPETMPRHGFPERTFAAECSIGQQTKVGCARRSGPSPSRTRLQLLA